MNTEITLTNTEKTLTNDKAYNTQMLKEVPGLKDSISPVVGNQIFFPKKLDISKEEYEELKNKHSVDENDYIHTKIQIDNKPFVFHQHISAIKEQNKSYYTYQIENFDLDGVKLIFDENIPICFKQSIILLAIHKKDINILSIAFEKEELVEVVEAFNNNFLQYNG